MGKELSLGRECLVAAAAVLGIAAMAKMIVASSSSRKTHIPPALSASKPKQQPDRGRLSPSPSLGSRSPSPPSSWNPYPSSSPPLGCFMDERDASIMHRLLHFMNQPDTPSPVMTARTFDRVIGVVGRRARGRLELAQIWASSSSPAMVSSALAGGEPSLTRTIFVTTNFAINNY